MLPQRLLACSSAAHRPSTGSLIRPSSRVVSIMSRVQYRSQPVSRGALPERQESQQGGSLITVAPSTRQAVFADEALVISGFTGSKASCLCGADVVASCRPGRSLAVSVCWTLVLAPVISRSRTLWALAACKMPHKAPSYDLLRALVREARVSRIGAQVASILVVRVCLQGLLFAYLEKRGGGSLIKGGAKAWIDSAKRSPRLVDWYEGLGTE